MTISRRDFVKSAAAGGAATAFMPIGASKRSFAAASDSFATGAGMVNRMPAWSSLEFGKISAKGDLGKRAEQNWRRLHHPAYSLPAIFDNPEIERWPGDWVGRTLLADILLARSTG